MSLANRVRASRDRLHNMRIVVGDLCAHAFLH
jgi:hypothetical protein